MPDTNVKTRFCVLFLCLLLTSCTSTSKKTVDPSIVSWAKKAKQAENVSFKRTIAEETAVHKREQAKYDAIIAHPEKYADVVDLQTGQVINNPPAKVGDILPDISNPNTPQTYTIPPKGSK